MSARANGPLAGVALVTNCLHLPGDEGTQRFAHELAREMRAQGGRVFGIGPANSPMARKLLLSRPLLRQVRASATLVVYVPSQSLTTATWLRTAVLTRLGRVHVRVAALQPRPVSRFGQVLGRLAAPDTVVTPSRELLESLNRVGIPSSFVPTGVDLERFQPVGPDVKGALRRKWGLPPSAGVVLHVGHLRRGRNLDWLAAARRELGVEAILVASQSMGSDKGVGESLMAAGVQVVAGFQPSVQELYQLADCYLFPVLDPQSAVGMPLSVLEAMACGLPVVTTPFGALPELLPEGEGLFYATRMDQAIAMLGEALKLSREELRTREAALRFSWPSVLASVLNEPATTRC